MAVGSWRCSHLNKYFYVGYDGEVIVDAQYENRDVKEIKS